MNDSIVYTKTARGLTALTREDRALSRDQLRALAAVDGRISVAGLFAHYPGVPRELMTRLLAELEQLGLIRPLPAGGEGGAAAAATASDGADALPLAPAQELDPEEGVRAWAEARRGARLLQEQGFFTHGKAGVPAQRSPAGLRVLVVEDDIGIARLLQQLLARQGFEVTHADSIPAALAALETPPAPDLVLLDVVLPGAPLRDGFHLLNRIRHHPGLARLPVIMVTSQSSDEQVHRGLREGADGYIFKPFQWPALYACVQSVLGLDA